MIHVLLPTVAVAGGGALGTMLRFALNSWAGFTELPVGTVMENLLGSLLLGLLAGWFAERRPEEWIRAGIGVGFCGGFTTMSTLASDLVFLIESFSAIHSFAYLFISMAGGVTLAWVGYGFGSRVSRHSPSGDRWMS